MCFRKNHPYRTQRISNYLLGKKIRWRMINIDTSLYIWYRGSNRLHSICSHFGCWKWLVGNSSSKFLTINRSRLCIHNSWWLKHTKGNWMHIAYTDVIQLKYYRKCKFLEDITKDTGPNGWEKAILYSLNSKFSCCIPGMAGNILSISFNLWS